MLKKLQGEREKLFETRCLFENLVSISFVVLLTSFGMMIAYFSNSDKKYLKLSSLIFASSGLMIVVSSSKCRRLDKQLDAYSVKINKVLHRKPGCHNCIYATEHELLPCAVHPIEQPDNCPDSKSY